MLQTKKNYGATQASNHVAKPLAPTSTTSLLSSDDASPISKSSNASSEFALKTTKALLTAGVIGVAPAQEVLGEESEDDSIDEDGIARRKNKMTTLMILVVNIVCSAGNYILVKFFMDQKASIDPQGRTDEEFVKPMKLPLTLTVVAHFIPALLLCKKFDKKKQVKPAVRDDECVDEERGLIRRGDSSGDEQDENVEEEKREIPWLFFFFSALCLMFGHLLSIVSLQGLMPSFVYMIKGTRVPFTGFLSRFFLHSKLRRHHCIGIALLLFGCGVLFSGFFYTDGVVIKAGEDADKVTGHATAETAILRGASAAAIEKPAAEKPRLSVGLAIAIALIAQLLASIQFVLQEGVFKKVPTLPSMQAVGIENSLAFLLAVCGLVLQNLRGKEKVIDTCYQFLNQPWFFLLFPMVFLCIIVSHVSGMLISKRLSAQTRTMVDVVKVCITFVLEPFILKNGMDYFKEQGAWKLVSTAIGYFVMVAGLLLYTEVVEIKRKRAPSSSRRSRSRGASATSFASEHLQKG